MNSLTRPSEPTTNKEQEKESKEAKWPIKLNYQRPQVEEVGFDHIEEFSRG